MIQQNHNVEFIFGGGLYHRVFKCNVNFSWEAVGEVDEELDFTLAENYEDARFGIVVSELLLTLPDAIWMCSFLADENKKLIIDDNEIAVVNDFKKLDFDYWNKSNIRSRVELKFRMKTIGIPEWALPLGTIEEIGVEP